MKAHRLNDTQVAIWCPGCESSHVIDVSPGRWKFNNDFESPTFAPSLLVRTGHYVTDQKREQCHICQNEPTLACKVCHSFIRDGAIQFLGDCTHAMVGLTVELPEWKGLYGEEISA